MNLGVECYSLHGLGILLASLLKDPIGLLIFPLDHAGVKLLSLFRAHGRSIGRGYWV